MTRLRHDCGARGCYLAARFDPVIFDGLLPGGSSFINLDAWAEIGRRHLVIEHKGAGVPIPTDGQGRALRRLALVPGFTVWFIRPVAGMAGAWEWADLAEREPLAIVSDMNLRMMIKGWGEAARAAA